MHENTESTVESLAHLAFCALIALEIARQDGLVSHPWAENLFLIRWLSAAQKRKLFPKSVAIDISWLLERGRKHGGAAKLRQQLEYLWRSCTGNLDEQSDLFRLTYATEILKDQGWESCVVGLHEWKTGTMSAAGQNSKFCVEKRMLSLAFTKEGKQQRSLPFRIVGDTNSFISVMTEHDLTARVTDSTSTYQVVILEPA